jgi:hypothetical protein
MGFPLFVCDRLGTTRLIIKASKEAHQIRSPICFYLLTILNLVDCHFWVFACNSSFVSAATIKP